MTYKEKHLHQAFGAMAVSLAMLVPAGCTKHKIENQTKQQVGLLNQTLIDAEDKYHNEVTLNLVHVPIYNKDGSRKTDQYVLTHGINNSSYEPVKEETYISKAYLNDSPRGFYVKIDKNRAILTEDGFSGLFVDKTGKVAIVADKNIPDFILELMQYSSSNKKRDNAIARNNSKAETLLSDSVKTNNDSIAAKTPVIEPDTAKTEELHINLADTLLKQQEIR